MDTPTNTTEVSQEKEKKRSPWLIVVIILLLFLVGCCILSVVFCMGSSRLPDLLDRYIDYDFDPDSDFDFDDFWGLVDEFGDLDKSKTPVYPDVEEVPDSGPSICDGLSGNLEMQVLVGPAEVVGLEPFGIGNIPFSVDTVAGSYVIDGGGTITFEDVLTEEWGFYTVYYDGEAVMSGACFGTEHSGTLNMVVETSGEQLIKVEAEGFQGEYPWTGTHDFDLSFPVEEGAIVSGEGWAFVLHLD